MYLAMISLIGTVVLGAAILFALPGDTGRVGALSIRQSQESAEGYLLGDALPMVHQAALAWLGDNPAFTGIMTTASVESRLAGSIRTAPRFEVEVLAGGALITRLAPPDRGRWQSLIVARANTRLVVPGLGIVRDGMIDNPVFGKVVPVPVGASVVEGEVVLVEPGENP